ALLAACRKAEHALAEAFGRCKVRKMPVSRPIFELGSGYQLREQCRGSRRAAHAVEREVRRVQARDGAPHAVPKLFFVLEQWEPHAAQDLPREAPLARTQPLSAGDRHGTETQIR